MLKNPENGGTPAMATAAQSMVQKVTGIFLRRPPMLRMSCSPRERVNHAAGAEEEQRLEEGVGHHVEDAGRERAARRRPRNM